MNAIALPSTRRGTRLGKIASLALPVAIGALAASAAYAGADTTFAPALQKFTLLTRPCRFWGILPGPHQAPSPLSSPAMLKRPREFGVLARHSNRRRAAAAAA